MSLQPPVGRWQQLAARLRSAIEQGEYPPGSAIPTEVELMEHYQLSRSTVRQAIARLRAEGLLEATPGRGTFVRHRSAVTVPLSRYTHPGVLQSNSTLGPWGAACKAHGLRGGVRMIEVARERADSELAEWLELSEGSDVIHRVRHMLANDQVAQIQEAWLPAELVEGTPLVGDDVAPAGTYATLIAAGHPPATINEHVTARMPTSDEDAVLQIGPGVPVLIVNRTTRDGEGRVLEVLRVVAPADRTALLYDGLPLRVSSS
jgi:GntR family transcriptional regulator